MRDQARSAQDQPESALRSPDDVFVSLSSDSNQPGSTPSTVKRGQATQGSQSPLDTPSHGSLPPLSDSVKGTPGPLGGSAKGSPGSLTGSVKGTHGPLSSSAKGTPIAFQHLPAASPSELQESVRSAARSTAMLSVPRRGRSNSSTVLAVTEPTAAEATTGEHCLLFAHLQFALMLQSGTIQPGPWSASTLHNLAGTPWPMSQLRCISIFICKPERCLNVIQNAVPSTFRVVSLTIEFCLVISPASVISSACPVAGSAKHNSSFF